MFSKSIVRLVAFLLVVAFATLFIGVASARPPQRGSDKDLVQTLPRGGHSTLDEEAVQFWYMKTTDFGATWAHFTQAGDVGTFSPYRGTLFADFQTVVTATNEICYVIYLDSAATRGVYSFTGPTFTPVLVMAAGTNILNTVGGTNPRGWTSVGKDPDGNLYALIWGFTAANLTTFWGVKSTDNGATWGTPFIIAQEPNIVHGAQYPHLSQMNSTSNVFVMYQAPTETAFNQYVGHFPVAGGAATFVQIGSNLTEFSYYIGASLPLAYDNVNNALYAAYRTDATGGSGTTVYFSNNQGTSFESYNLATGGTRYPSVALRIADQIPFVVSNFGVPNVGTAHTAWYTYDQLGYGSGSWVIPPVILATAPAPYNGTGPLLYVNQMYWWDATHGAAMNNIWGANTPEGAGEEHTTDGGSTWSPFHQLWSRNDSVNAPTANMNQIAGGTNGIAYITTSFARGITDTIPPIVYPQTLITPPTSTGPYVVEAGVGDNNFVAVTTVNWWWQGSDSTIFQGPDSVIFWYDITKQSGIYRYHIPDTSWSGHHWVAGDSIFFYVDATDNNNNYFAHETQVIVVGSAWLGAGDRHDASVTSFALLGNYPNPFNPSTQIAFDLPALYRVNLKVYNILGEQVATVLDGQAFEQGHHTISFDGSALTSGVYFYTITAGPYTASHKMVLLK